MTSRAFASIALGAAVLLGATGCSMISPQATTIQYSPAEGVNISHDSAPVRVLNTLVVATDDGRTGNLVAVLANDTAEDQTVTFDIAGQTLPVDVPADSRVTLGAEHDPLRIDDLDTLPGRTVEVIIVSGDGAGVMTHIPVLDGQLAYLADLVPSTATRK